jgi:hypothetical protein
MINQVKFSRSVQFFEKGFCKRWSVDFYKDIDKPCLFVGLYRQEDIDVINQHNGFKVVWLTGKIQKVFQQLNPDNLVILISNGVDVCIPAEYKVKQGNIQIKDFSMFKPNKLGNKIYCYLGNGKGKHIMGYDLINQLKLLVEYKIIEGYQGHSMEQVKNNYYDNCFVNVKPNLTGGLTSAIELAKMGRYTISNSKALFCKNYEGLEDMVKLIEIESKKIGTIQPSLIDGYFNIGEEWKQEKFWE